MQVRVGGRFGLRPGAEARAGLVAAVLLADPAVDARFVHIGGGVRAAAGGGGPVGSAPAVARGVDDHAEVLVEARADERVAEVEGEALLVDVGVVVHPVGLLDRHAADHVVGVEVRFDGRGVTGGVGGDPGDVAGVDAHGEQLAEQLDGVAELVVGGVRVLPSDHGVVGRVEVVVDADGGELGDGVGDALHVVPVVPHPVALLGGVGAGIGVGGQVGDRVRLHHRHDVQVVVRRVADDLGDRVDELGFVAVDLLGAELPVRAQCGAVPAGEVVEDDLDQVVALGRRHVEVVRQSHAGGALAGDGADAVEPHGRRLLGDLGGRAAAVGLGRPFGIDVDVGALVRVRRLGSGIAVTAVLAGVGLEVRAPVAAMAVRADRGGGREDRDEARREYGGGEEGRVFSTTREHQSSVAILLMFVNL